ncbi:MULTISPECIES: oxaloacetate decarboxylase [Lacrimispora]|uniref:oxaloacetate decarboxylase n=1 Tax=Lacrimispora TaxID=2719231 RepID=UPI000BE28130|nr:oxaloacetate decarboxylase [Lacrimispora amygdalina]MDK2966584.1 hypothetical protein [Lacrimispora sp.]
MMKWICGLLSIAGGALIIAGAYFAGNKAVTVIGGADGPTAIFIAGKPDHVTSTAMLVSGIIIILGILIIIVKNHSNK